MKLRPRVHPSLERGALLALCSAVWLAGCNLDERPLSFTVGDRASLETAGSGGAGAPSPTGEGGNAVGGGDGAAGDANGGENSDPKGGAPSNGGTGGSAPSNGGTGGDAPIHGGSGGSAPIDGGTGGNGTAGNATGGSGGALGNAGSGGVPFISLCGDLNQNRVDDCDETLVKNSRFDTAASGWDAEPALHQLWDPTNASGGSSSGALLVENVNELPELGGNTAVGSRQCLRAWTGQRFDVGARVFIKSGQGTGKAAVNLLFYAGDGCTGDFIDGKTVDTVADVDAWRVINGEISTPAATRSMYVRLLASKPFTQASFQVLFDDVLVSEKQ